MLFALSKEVSNQMQRQFAGQLISKRYWALVRGFVEDSGEINYALKKENGNLQKSITRYRKLKHIEIDIPLGKFSTSRYSLVEVEPLTGRMHQIRKHFAHINHPIIGDRPHGCNKQNRLFKETWGITHMFLHAQSLEFTHPISKQKISIESPIQAPFSKGLNTLSFSETKFN